MFKATAYLDLFVPQISNLLQINSNEILNSKLKSAFTKTDCAGLVRPVKANVFREKGGSPVGATLMKI